MIALALLMGGLGAWLVAQMLHAIPEVLVDPSKGQNYGTCREYGHITSNAQRSWLKRHYLVPYEKHGRLYLEPDPINRRLGLAHEVGPGDDAYGISIMGSEPGGMTVNLYHT